MGHAESHANAGGQLAIAQGVALRGREDGATAELTGDVMTALRCGGGGGDKPHVLLPFDETQITSSQNRCNPQPGDPAHPLSSQARPPTICFLAKDHGADAMDDLSPTLRAGGFDKSHANAGVMPAVLTNWRVRRLTPRECERLQGFPEITKSVTVSVWPSIDQAENAARAETLNPKSQRSASNAEGSGSALCASAADGRLSIGHQSPVPRVAVTVRIDCERQQVDVLRTGRLIWSANIAGKPGGSPLLMPVADFVQLVANMLTRLDQTTHAGGAGSRVNINAFSDHLNGSASVHLSGGEIAVNAGDAEMFTMGVAACMKFTTSGVGRSFQISEPIWKTWCCCVTRAIGSCIPEEIRAASSFDVSIKLTHGYTAIPYRVKYAADGPRYKALGNSMAVNCMRWIGRRIEMVERICAQADRPYAEALVTGDVP